MKNNINLIDSRLKPVDKNHDKKYNSLKIIAASLLVIVGIFSVTVFILISISPLSTLRKQSKIAATNLSLHNDVIIKQELVKERLNSIKIILDKRSNFDKLLEYLQSILPPGVNIDTFTLNKKDLQITFSSKSLLELDNLLKGLISQESEKKFSNVTLVKLSISENGNTFLIVVSLNIL